MAFYVRINVSDGRVVTHSVPIETEEEVHKWIDSVYDTVDMQTQSTRTEIRHDPFEQEVIS